jgi:repressor LexA
MKFTARQLAIIEAIDLFILKHKYSPTMRELADAVGIKSSSTIFDHLKNLQKRGVVHWDPSKPRTLTIVKRPI